jgi:hypothetical protein
MIQKKTKNNNKRRSTKTKFKKKVQLRNNFSFKIR